MDLYAVRVEKKEKSKITLKVFVTYEDADIESIPFDDGKFFLAVFVEQLGSLNKGLEQLSPLALEVLACKRSKSEASTVTVGNFLRKQEPTSSQTYISEVLVKKQNIPKTKSKGIYQRQFDEETGIFRENEAEITWVLFEITMTDEKWVSHLLEGQIFGTVQYFD